MVHNDNFSVKQSLSHGEVIYVSFIESVGIEEVVLVCFMKAVGPGEVFPVSLKHSVSLQVILSSKEVLHASERRGSLIDLFTVAVSSTEMVLEIPFSFTVGVWSVTCKIQKCPHALGSSFSYFQRWFRWVRRPVVDNARITFVQ